MNLDQAIAEAEAILPGQAAPQGELDSRWQAIIAVSEFMDAHPEQVWLFARKWGAFPDSDLRMAISTCLLEHLLEHHFDSFISRVEEAVSTDVLFADTVSHCWKFGQSTEPARADRFGRLQAFIRSRTAKPRLAADGGV